MNSKTIFLFDGAGAVSSFLVTGLLLPLFSEAIGIPKNILYGLALFPLLYGVYSFSCYMLPARKPWTLLAIIFANAFYGAVSGTVMLLSDSITTWGYLLLSGELLVLSAVVALEWSVYKKEFRGR